MEMRQFRRIITAQREDGRSYVLSDEPASQVFTFPSTPGYGITHIWKEDSLPPALDGEVDPHESAWSLEAPPGQLKWRIVERPPDTQGGDIGSLLLEVGGHDEETSNADSKVGMHQTNSLSLVIILSGEQYMVSDEGEVLLKAGDCVVQRGTRHAWHNRGTEPCFMAAISVSTEHPHRGLRDS